MFAHTEWPPCASAARALLVTGLLLGVGACSHQQPIATRTGATI